MENTAENVTAVEIEHPEMLIGASEHDSRLDVRTFCEYTENTETYD